MSSCTLEEFISAETLNLAACLIKNEENNPEVINSSKLFKNKFFCVERNCKEVFKSLSALSAHKRVHYSTLHRCEYCNLSFKPEEVNSLLPAHIEEFHIKNDPLTCKKCKRTSKNKEALWRHVRESHRPMKFGCDICGFQFTRPENLKVHILQSHGDNVPLKCKTCGALFRHKNSLKSHIRYLHRETGDLLACEFCKKQFRRKDSLRNHVKWHLAGEVKRFGCTVCNLKFRTKTHLTRHNTCGQHNINVKKYELKIKQAQKKCNNNGRMTRGSFQVETLEIPEEIIIKLEDPSFSSRSYQRTATENKEVNEIVAVKIEIDDSNIDDIVKSEVFTLDELEVNTRTSHRQACIRQSQSCDQTTKNVNSKQNSRGIKRKAPEHESNDVSMNSDATSENETEEDSEGEIENEENMSSTENDTSQDEDCEGSEDNVVSDEDNEVSNKIIPTKKRGRPRKSTNVNIVKCITAPTRVHNLRSLSTEKNTKTKLYCMYCDKEYVSQKSVQKHEIACAEQRKRVRHSHSCQTCGKIFMAKYLLQKHQFVHQTARPFKCNLCEMRFKTERYRQNHVNRIHRQLHKLMPAKVVNTRIHTCVDCNKSYTTIKCLRRHYESHHTSIRFHCNICGKSYKRKEHIRVHKKYQHEDDGTRFECKPCNKLFKRPEVFNTHLRTNRHKMKADIFMRATAAASAVMKKKTSSKLRRK